MGRYAKKVEELLKHHTHQRDTRLEALKNGTNPALHDFIEGGINARDVFIQDLTALRDEVQELENYYTFVEVKND